MYFPVFFNNTPLLFCLSQGQKKNQRTPQLLVLSFLETGVDLDSLSSPRSRNQDDQGRSIRGLGSPRVRFLFARRRAADFPLWRPGKKEDSQRTLSRLPPTSGRTFCIHSTSDENTPFCQMVPLTE